MQNSLPAQLKRPRFSRLLLAQSSTVLAVAVLASIFGGKSAALSALLGGLVCWLPNAYFAWRAFRYQGARLASNIVKSFYRAE
ncbi:MAG TPA: ATP synthase subunit I, partial [Modicisalibacter sp.]|nr:ATP synthase subunit I [Modicisalibacter sp.]